MYSKHGVINNLREEKKKLEETIRNMETQEKAYTSCIDELTEKNERSKEAHKECKLALIKCNNAWAKLYDQLETIKEFVLSREADIQLDLEDLGMLKPVLSYFLEEAQKG